MRQDGHIQHLDRADRLAKAVCEVGSADRLRALLIYHELHGGGLRWFLLSGDAVVPLAPPSAQSSRYGFRLWALCRVAAQCGVINKIPSGLANEAADGDEETDDER